MTDLQKLALKRIDKCLSEMDPMMGTIGYALKNKEVYTDEFVATQDRQASDRWSTFNNNKREAQEWIDALLKEE